jgi:hypothetical protein
MNFLDNIEALAKEARAQESRIIMSSAAVLAMVAVCKAAKLYLEQYEGVYDCVDNDGDRYQSQGAADDESALRSAIEALDAMQ